MSENSDSDINDKTMVIEKFPVNEDELSENNNVEQLLEHISKLKKHIEHQNKKICKLRHKVKRQQNNKSKELIDNSTQTEPADDESQAWSVNPQNGSTNILDQVKQVAELATHQSGFVYEETSGLYYDYNTGYYYDAVQRLYYDGNSGTYYSYDEESKSYKIHSQVAINGAESLKSKKRKVKSMGNEAPEEGECSESESTSESIENESENEKDIAKTYPPCMRIVVKETGLKQLKLGALFIVTYTGGSLGREGNHSVLIPDLNVSKQHARIQYDEEKKRYEIVDLGSRNGTILNGKRLSVAKQESEPIEMSHGSIIEVGCTKLLCHIHNGHETCGHCEPGLIQQNQNLHSTESVSIQQQHKSELKRLKNKFGVKKDNTQSASQLASGYQDRAQSRRDYVGSSNHFAKTEQSSIHTSITKNNKGFKLLAKMGWSEGQSLGKDKDGMVEPIPLINNSTKCGFGSLNPDYCNIEVAETVEKKSRLWRKARERFDQIDESLDKSN